MLPLTASLSHTKSCAETHTRACTHSENADSPANAMEGHGRNGHVYIHALTHTQAFIQTDFHTLK